MISETIDEYVASMDGEAVEALFEDYASVFWVDWREDDAILPEYCDSVLKTGQLSADIEGERIFVKYKDSRLEVPLTQSSKDRHITLVAINEAIKDDYEIRFVRASDGADTLAFAPLSNADWESLEAKYDHEAVESAFMKLADSPNVFTDPLGSVAPAQKAWWQFWK